MLRWLSFCHALCDTLPTPGWVTVFGEVFFPPSLNTDSSRILAFAWSGQLNLYHKLWKVTAKAVKEVLQWTQKSWTHRIPKEENVPFSGPCFSKQRLYCNAHNDNLNTNGIELKKVTPVSYQYATFLIFYPFFPMIIHPEEGKQGRCRARFSVPRVVLLQDAQRHFFNALYLEMWSIGYPIGSDSFETQLSITFHILSGKSNTLTQTHPIDLTVWRCGRPGRPGAIRMCSRLQQQAGDLQLALHRCELQATLGIRVSVCVQKMTHNPGGADPCQGIWHEHSENMGIEASKMENTWGYIWKILEMGTHPLVIQQLLWKKWHR